MVDPTPEEPRVEEPAVPSVLWFEGDRVVVGKAAKEQLRMGDNASVEHIVKSPKLHLGKRNPIQVGGRDFTPAEVAAELFKYLRDEATGKFTDKKPSTEAVVTIPVTMQGPGRRALREAAQIAGIGVVQFVHEPLAALYAYFKKGAEPDLARLENQVVLVFDWGGGTLDMTLVGVRDGNLCQILNHGMDTVGGDEFDWALMSHCKKRFLVQHGAIEEAILPGREKVHLDRCEQAKIALSTRAEHPVFVPGFARIAGAAQNLEITVTRADMEEATRFLVDQATRELRALLERANIAPTGVALCLATGGMVLMPVIYERLTEIFDGIRVPQPSEIGSATLISEGAAWIAYDQSRLTLAKPVELELASRRYLPLLDEGKELPYGETHLTTDPITPPCQQC